MTENDFIWRFTPSRTEPEVLESIFVQRQNLLASILDRVSESATTDNKHHLLLIGQRGIGKTHLISLLNYRIQQKADLATRLRIAWFLEDETITSFVQLLKRIYQLLAEEYPAEFPIQWLNNLLDEAPERIEKALEAELVRCFENQTLLLFIENLDYVFDGLNKEGQQKWRSFLQENPFTCIVATSQRLFSGMKDRDQPFFGFFTPIHLKPLQVDNAVDLLGHIAEQRVQPDLEQYLRTPEGRSRVRALHHLAGGNHRIYIVLSGFITRDSLDELTQPFEKMADELTPYYQERMRWLSPQQRQIVEFLCAQDSPCTPKEMARQLLAAENTISSQLKKLLEYGYVMKSPRGRESLYELTEPLMRLASEVKDKRRKPLRLLVDFLRIWYRPDHLPELMEAAVNESLRAHISAAIDRTHDSPCPTFRAVCDDLEHAREQGRLNEVVDLLEELAHVRPSAETWSELGFYQQRIKQFASAETSYEKALSLDPKSIVALTSNADLLRGLRRFDEARRCVDRALELCPTDANGLSIKAALQCDLGLATDAMESVDAALATNPQHSYALSVKGALLYKSKNYGLAVACFDAVLKATPENTFAWNGRGVSLLDQGQSEEAISCFERAIELDPEYVIPRFNLPEALFSIGNWNVGFDKLRSAFSLHPSHTRHDVESKIANIEKRSSSLLERVNRVSTLIQIYHDGGSISHLGDGLVRSLGKLDADRLSEKALAEWRYIWLEAASEHAEMEIPLRIFSVGIEYFIKKDERVLLDLIATERRILQQAIGLESPADSDSED